MTVGLAAAERALVPGGRLAGLALSRLPRSAMMVINKAIGFRLADGGVLGITSLERIDRFSLNAKARGFVLPSDLRALLETSVVKEGFRTRTIETIAFTTRGTPTLVGASEQLRSASAS